MEQSQVPRRRMPTDAFGYGAALPFVTALSASWGARAAQAEPIPQAFAQGLVQNALIDPNDPTKLYVPTVTATPVKS